MLFFEITLSVPYRLLCVRSIPKLVNGCFKRLALGTYRYMNPLALFLLDRLFLRENLLLKNKKTLLWVKVCSCKCLLFFFCLACNLEYCQVINRCNYTLETLNL